VQRQQYQLQQQQLLHRFRIQQQLQTWPR
jgi:hypothetical protein